MKNIQGITVPDSRENIKNAKVSTAIGFLQGEIICDWKIVAEKF